jgi:hypothetical protein
MTWASQISWFSKAGTMPRLRPWQTSWIAIGCDRAIAIYFFTPSLELETAADHFQNRRLTFFRKW